MYISAKIARGKLFAKLILSLCFTLFIILFPEISRKGVADGISLCLNLLIPSLFPFFFIFDYLYGLLIPTLRNKKRWLSLLITFIFALVGGFPMGAKLLSSLERSGIVSKKRASFLLCGLVNAGPAYLITGVGLSLFNNVSAGVFLFIALSLSSLLLFIAALIFTKIDYAASVGRSEKEDVASFSSSLSFALSATARLCSYVTVFSVIVAIARFSLEALNITGALPLWGVSAFLEVSSACSLASGTGSTLGLYLCLSAVSLCGLSVTLQISSFVKPQGISLAPFLLSRPLHLLLSVGAMRLLCSLFPTAKPVFFTAGETTVFVFTAAPAVSLFLFLTALIFVAGSKEFSLFTN